MKISIMRDFSLIFGKVFLLLFLKICHIPRCILRMIPKVPKQIVSKLHLFLEKFIFLSVKLTRVHVIYLTGTVFNSKFKNM